MLLGYSPVLLADNRHWRIISPLHQIKLEATTAYGIRTVTLSGDKSVVVEIVAEQVGIDQYYSGLLSEDKVTYVERPKAY